MYKERRMLTEQEINALQKDKKESYIKMNEIYANMNNKNKEILNDAINSIKALSINELESDFKSFGINVIKKPIEISNTKK